MIEAKELDVSEQEQVRLMLKALREIRYGSIEVTIHDARIVQIETREKVRFEK